MNQTKILQKIIPSSNSELYQTIDFNAENEVRIKNETLEAVQVNQMETTLHRCTFALTFTHPHKKSTGRGSGFLISENLGVTCAHNIYDKNQKVYYQNFRVFPGAFGLMLHYYEVEAFFIPEEFKEQTSPKKAVLNDYALLKLKSTVASAQYLRLGANFSEFKAALAIYGYPADNYTQNQNSTLFSTQQYGLQQANKILIPNKEDIDLKRIRYTISTLQGQSGSPIVIARDNRTDVIAIHKGGNAELQFNYGRLITIDMLINFELWREKCKASPFVCFDYSNNDRINFQEQTFREIVSLIRQQRASIITLKQQIKVKYEGNQFYSEISQLKSQINSLQSGYEGQRQQENFKEEKETLMKLLAEKQVIIHGLKEKVVLMQKKIEELKLSSKRVQEHHGGFDITVKRPQVGIASIQWNLRTPYAQKYTVTEKSIRKNTNDGICQIISAQPLADISSVKFKILKYGEYISLGFTMASRFNQKQSGGLEMRDSVGYWTDCNFTQGDICVNGESKVLSSGELFIKEGYSLIMEVNKNSKIIYFRNEFSNFKKQLRLPENFLHKDIYVYVSLNHYGDCVEVTS